MASSKLYRGLKSEDVNIDFMRAHPYRQLHGEARRQSLEIEVFVLSLSNINNDSLLAKGTQMPFTRASLNKTGR